MELFNSEYQYKPQKCELGYIFKCIHDQGKYFLIYVHVIMTTGSTTCLPIIACLKSLSVYVLK